MTAAPNATIDAILNPPTRTPTSLRGLKIAELMQWGEPFTARELAGTLGVSQRAVRDDIAELRSYGFNIRGGAGTSQPGQYRLERHTHVYPVFLDPEQLADVIYGLNLACDKASAGGESAEHARISALRNALVSMAPAHIADQVSPA